MADANNYPRNALYGEPTMSAYNEPWYRRIPNALTDYIYGPNANAHQAAGVRQWAGPENPLNVPARAYQAGETIGQGYIGGDPAMMAMGGLGLGLEAVPAFARAPRPGMFEAVNDARMAKQLDGDTLGWKPAAFDRNFRTAPVYTDTQLWREQKFMKRHGEVRPASEKANYLRHPGYEPDDLARHGQLNNNELLRPDELRRLFRVVD